MSKVGVRLGKGGEDMVVLEHPSGALAEIYFWGATLTRYKTPNGREIIFCSPGAIFDGKKAIRGGVPIVFPQFGQPSKAMPQHGFARTSRWTHVDTNKTAEACQATFILQDSAETRAVWDFPFTLEYTVTLRAVSLTMHLKIHNVGTTPFNFHALLHTYLSIPDIGVVRVAGLTGRSYIDKVEGGENKVEENNEIALPSFTDRVYIGAGIPEACDVVVSEAGGLPLAMTINEARISGEVVPCDVVIWNPYEGASPGDLPPPAFKEFICVEPGLVSNFRDLPANGVAEVWQKILPVA